MERILYPVTPSAPGRAPTDVQLTSNKIREVDLL
jgi:hypothetical protein